FQIYKKRYSGEDNPLLSDYKRDAAFLLTASADAKSSNSAWTGEDRVDMAQRALPLLFKDKEALKAIAQAVLQRLLPSSHPKWSASQDEWFTWWAKHKDALEKK